MLKEEKETVTIVRTSAQPDDELTAYGKYIAATLRGMDKFHQELAKMKIGQVYLKFNIPQQAEMIKLLNIGKYYLMPWSLKNLLLTCPRFRLGYPRLLQDHSASFGS